jgi:hypothetical protein
VENLRRPRAFDPKEAVKDAIRVRDEAVRRAHPGAELGGLVWRSHGDEDHIQIRVLAQLRDMLAAKRSTEVTQEDERERSFVQPGERDAFAGVEEDVDLGQPHVGFYG